MVSAIHPRPAVPGGGRRRSGMAGGSLCLMLLLWGLQGAVQADVLRWRDADGQVHYGDKPPEGAESVEQVETFECQTEACREDLEQRRRDNAETNEQLEEWLQSRQAERDAARAAGERESVIYMPTYPPYPPILVAPAVPGVPCLHGRDCSGRLRPGHRLPGKYPGRRPIYSDGHSSSRHNRRTYGFPATR